MATDKQMDVEKLIEEVRLMDCSSLIVPAIRQLAKERDTIAVALTVALELAHENDKRAEKALARQHKAEGELKEIKHRMEGLEK